MPFIVGVRFQPAGKVYYFDPGSLEIDANDQIIVPTPQGTEMASAAFGVKEVIESDRPEPLKRVVRKATNDDLEAQRRWLGRQREALEHTRRIGEAIGLAVKFTAAEFSYDGRRLTVSYTAPERADLGALPGQLQSIFEARVDSRHVGDRDMARQLGDLGLCGRTLCCKSWLTDFPPVSIKMAKNQDLPLNPTKISGACGRLLCCLAYENDQYSQVRSRVPRYGSEVETPQGRGIVRDPHILRESVNIYFEEGGLIEVPLTDIRR